MEVKCDVCGKVRTDMGLKLGIIDESTDVETREQAREQMKPYELRAYHVCIPCFLKALGIKPESEKQA